MMHRAWSSIVEVPYCFSRSYIKLQGHTALKIVEFDPNWAFPDCNSSLNSPMAMKCCRKLETAKERCPIVFQGHSSNFKVTRYKTSPILTQIGRFRTIGRSQLSNPSDLPCSNLTVGFFSLDGRHRWLSFHLSSHISSVKCLGQHYCPFKCMCTKPVRVTDECGGREHILLLAFLLLYMKIYMMCSLNTLRLRHNGRHLVNNIFKCIFLNENFWISNNMSLKCVPLDLIDNMSSLVQIMAWCRISDKPLSEPMMI